jgi:hypothetical protein
MAGDIKNPDNEKFDKIKSLKKKGLLNKKGKIIKPIELKEKNIRDDMRKDTAQELPRGLQIDTNLKVVVEQDTNLEWEFVS